MLASFWVIAPLLARCMRPKYRWPAAAPIGTRRSSVDHGAGEARAELPTNGGYVSRRRRGPEGAAIDVPVTVGHPFRPDGRDPCPGHHPSHYQRRPATGRLDVAELPNRWRAASSGAGSSAAHDRMVWPVTRRAACCAAHSNRRRNLSMAVAMTGVMCNWRARATRAETLPSRFDVLTPIGAVNHRQMKCIRVCPKRRRHHAGRFRPRRFQLSADLAGPLMASDGPGAQGLYFAITENDLENRFMHCRNWRGRRADIISLARTATHEGIDQLRGARLLWRRSARLGVRCCDPGPRVRRRRPCPPRLPSRPRVLTARGKRRLAGAPSSASRLNGSANSAQHVLGLFRALMPVLLCIVCADCVDYLGRIRAIKGHS